MPNQTIKCPVCQRQFVKQGIKNHIINSAKSEVWKGLKEKPHKVYFDSNQIKIDSNKFIFKD
jgi:hypothetical protein